LSNGHFIKTLKWNHISAHLRSDVQGYDFTLSGLVVDGQKPLDDVKVPDDHGFFELKLTEAQAQGLRLQLNNQLKDRPCAYVTSEKTWCGIPNCPKHPEWPNRLSEEKESD